ncbi:MAG: DNA-binding response regulator [Bacteroidetes bacterium GWA2_32_17]|nr:MAG: DNA-binding response regulator [Bacteroidetes bacterium GWA2_32_17]
MKKISCIIVDDEPLAIDLLERYICKTPFLDYKNRYSNAIEALEILNKQTIDLIFLDIQMPDLTGIEFSRLMGKEIRIIFTTAFNEYAIEGFKANAIDYLLKPFNYEEFLRAANKAKEWFELKDSHNKLEVNNKDYIFVKSEYKQIIIYLDDVLYIEGLKDYVKIYLKSDPKPILSIYSLKALEAKLPEAKFMRVHRSFIVNLSSIKTIERSRIVYGKVYIPVTDQYKEKFQEYLSKNCL